MELVLVRDKEIDKKTELSSQNRRARIVSRKQVSNLIELHQASLDIVTQLTIHLEAVNTVKGPASGLKSEPQVTPAGDTVEEMDQGSASNSKGRGEYTIEDPAPPTLEGPIGDKEPQETGDRASPAPDGLLKCSEQDKVALEALQRVENSPKSPSGVMHTDGGKWR